MKPEIIKAVSRKLVGVNMSMSLVDNHTAGLWRSFMPRLKEISSRAGDDLISVQIYGPHYFKDFSPAAVFEKWAAVEVNDFENLPRGMSEIIIPGGDYAVFRYKGPAGGGAVYQYIFNTWLPSSAYQLDERPHYEVMGEKYSQTDPDSEEDIFIPVKPRL